MSLIMIGVFSDNPIGIKGAIFLAVSHGLIISMMFIISGILQEKTGSNNLNELGGLASKMPYFALFFMISILATLGVPGFSNFIGELLIFLGAYFTYAFTLVAIGAILITTNYYLYATKSVLFSKLNKNFSSITDINIADKLQLAFISALILLIGILPSIILRGVSI